MEKTKKCKYCKTEIPADAKVCPQCRKKLKGGKFKWILLALIVLCAIGAATGGSNSNSSTKSTDSTLSKKEDAPKEYTSVLVNDLMADGDFEIIGVQCYIKNDEQKTKVASMTKGETVTLKGKCTDVGEVFGYSLDIDEIE